MKPKIDVIIVGGGLAGLTSAIHLSRAGLQVTLIEKNSYPQHKVCGEYVSNEVISYLQSLDSDPTVLSPVAINNLLITTTFGKQIQSKLPLGGFGISRYLLDEFLYNKAKANGCTCIQDTVNDIRFDDNTFFVDTQNSGQLAAEIVIGAYGKRAIIDQKLNRDFIKHKSPWLAVKAHYKGDFPDDLVALHTFDGGYCGISNVEQHKINICYLADYRSFKEYRNPASYQKNVMYRNPNLRSIFEDSEILFEAPLTISQINFEKKELVKEHVLMVGDTAGLIHPLCGNGMAMAIHSAKICADTIIGYFQSLIRSREALEKQYIAGWNNAFRTRLAVGRKLSGILKNERLSRSLFSGLSKMPFLLPMVIKKTHGKPILV